MPPFFEQPILSLSTRTIDSRHDFGLDDLSTMWTVFSKCKAHLENGYRLENMSWRLWYHEKQSASMDYFSYTGPVSQSACSPMSTGSNNSNNSNSSSLSSSTSSSLKRFISSLDHDSWPCSTKNSNDATSKSDDSPSRQTWQRWDQEANQHTSADTPHSHANDALDGTVQVNDTRNATGMDDLYDEEEEDTSDLNDDDSDDDLDDLEDDLDDSDDPDDSDEVHTIFEFTKKQPQQQLHVDKPSLLSMLLRQQQPKMAEVLPQATPTSPVSRRNSYQRLKPSSGPCPPGKTTAREHFLHKELSESLRRSVLWEHIQQRNHGTHLQRKQASHEQTLSTEPTSSSWLENFSSW